MLARNWYSPLVAACLLFVGARAQNDAGATCPLPLTTAQKTLLDEATFQLHYNGNPTACGTVAPQDLPKVMSQMLEEMELCQDAATALADKYSLETFLTNAFHSTFDNLQGDDTICASYDDADKKNDGFFGFCDMGPDRTPPQPDDDNLIPTVAGTLPCRFYTREGVRIATLTQLVDLLQNKKLEHLEKCGKEETCAASYTTPMDLYAVPANRVFMFAPAFVGETFELPHVLDAAGNPLSMKVLSLEPRVFDIFNFFSEDEAQTLIDKALKETSSTHGLHRSTTGATNGAVFSKRTSENAWDTHGKLAART